jgi:hypothetical protein
MYQVAAPFPSRYTRQARSACHVAALALRVGVRSFAVVPNGCAVPQLSFDLLLGGSTRKPASNRALGGCDGGVAFACQQTLVLGVFGVLSGWSVGVGELTRVVCNVYKHLPKKRER